MCTHTITSHTLFNTSFIQLRMATFSMSCLAKLWASDTEKQRQCRHDDARLTESRNACSEQLLMWCVYRTTNQLRTASRRALEMFKGPAGFLDTKYQIQHCINFVIERTYHFIPYHLCAGSSNLTTTNEHQCVIQHWFRTLCKECSYTIQDQCLRLSYP